MRELLGARRVQAQNAWPLIARMREETAPETGYLWFRGDYVRPEQHAQILLDEELDRLAELLPRAEQRDRDELYERLFVNDRDAQLAVALEARWRQAVRDLERSRSLSELEQLAATRTELDERRAAALELIFDEVTYFYPYRVPEVSSDKAQEYPPVQRRVDDLVDEVELLWELPRQVTLPESIHAALDEFAWCRVRFDELELAPPSLASEPDGEELPDWVAGLPALEVVSLREFAWSAEEAAVLARSREVVQLNEAQWQRAWDEDENQQRAMSHDQEQVRITNAYRAMLGRHALAWNPRIQAAARDHSEWMDQTGEFGHFEPGRPESYGPSDRMRLRGYAGGASENVAATRGSAMSAHQGWCRSSGHHRNLLMSGHKEMASSGVGRLWTQNFGMGRSFEEELERLREDQEE